MILLFIGILSIVFLAARFFINDSYTVHHYFEKIPGIEAVYGIVRSVPPYLGEIGEMMF